MRLTIVGSGDAFGSGGRLNTCFFLETAKAALLVDCGASALPALKRLADRAEPDRRHRAFAFARRPFRRAAVSFARRAVSLAPRTSAADCRSARYAGAPRCRAGSVLPEIERLEMALCLARRGNPGRRAVRRARPFSGYGRGHPPVGRAVDRAAAVGRRQNIRLFGRYRMDRRAAADRARCRSVHLRMLRLCRQVSPAT